VASQLTGIFDRDAVMKAARRSRDLIRGFLEVSVAVN
jgi:hypothetical protein